MSVNIEDNDLEIDQFPFFTYVHCRVHLSFLHKVTLAAPGLACIFSSSFSQIHVNADDLMWLSVRETQKIAKT